MENRSILCAHHILSNVNVSRTTVGISDLSTWFCSFHIAIVVIEYEIPSFKEKTEKVPDA